MRLHIVQHESFEAPGAIAVWAENRGHEINYTRVYRHERLPLSADAFDFLLVLGGPQSPDTTQEQCPHFAADREIELINRAIAQDKAVLGICLGAQLLGKALGAGFEPSPCREIGVFPLTLTDAGRKDPLFSTFPQTFSVGHWHGDMPGLTEDAVILAGSAGCPRQIIRYKPKVYGFQCHFEFTRESIAGMIKNCSEELAEYKTLPFVQDAATLTEMDYSEMNGFLYKFLDYIADRQALRGKPQGD
ncbi:MAG: gamma-glutamyl-gamma-aminobutyrate hydrolase family protein [Deltaproteobacteria bacterium]|nr:gamma-glutamyl-gamma-aminobutyrate hydrolase family protein [Deltaproteobacteria bacterium]